MKLKKIKKDIIESIKSSTSKVRNEEFDFKVQAFANPSFVGAIENSRKNRELAQKRMKEKNDEQKEFIKATVERKANATPKTDAMKKMKMIEKFIKESFKDKLTINENIFTVTTKSRAELKKLIENARKHEVKYTIERINEEYKFNYKFESLNKKLESVKSAYASGDMFETYEEFVKIDKNKTETIATKTIRNSELAKEIGIKSIKELFTAFEQDGGNDDVDALFLEVIQALDEEFNTRIYEGYLKEGGSLTTSTFKDIIGEYFDYSFDFEFLDIVANVLDRIDFEEKSLEDEIEHAIDSALTYINDLWTIAKHYASTPENLVWSDVLTEFAEDIHNLVEKISDKKDLGESKTVRVKKNIKKSFRR